MKTYKIFTFICLVFILPCITTPLYAQKFKLPPLVTKNDYLEKRIIFKVKSDYREFCSEIGVNIPALNKIFLLLEVNRVWKKFPGEKKPETVYNKYREKMVDISLIYELNYSKNINIERAVNYLLSSGVLLYAEPNYVPKLLFVPDDPAADTNNISNFKQCALKKIKAYQAWDIQKGDTNIVVGITDTGTDIFHPDLLPNLKKNYFDPINGKDDDNDGFPDNYYGWDLGENDSFPQWKDRGHGVFVSGLTAAVVNNSIGIAGVGFKSKYLPVKIDDANGNLVKSYEGIIYAVTHGCDVVNCSWGGYFGAGNFGQDVINYAVNNKDAVVVAAAGNSNNSFLIYPASYDNVLSVANVDCNDVRAPNSSYGNKVDLSAPGRDVYSTWINSGYTISTGTSFSAPLVSGAAALLKVHFPDYSAIQIAQQIKATTDNIDAIPANIPYAGSLGTGRLNLYRALTETENPSVFMQSRIVTDNNDKLFNAKDTLRIWGNFKNFLAPTTGNFKVTISSDCPYVQILNKSSALGVIPKLGIKSNESDKFTIKILPNIPVSYQIDFKLKYEDATLGYVAYESFSVMANINYIDVDTNKVATTITSKGKIGYNQINYQQGLGFTYKNGPTYMGTGGFLVGNSNSQVSDNLYGATSETYDNDFKSQQIIRKVVPPVRSDFHLTGIFNDSLAGTSKMGLSVRYNTYAWDSANTDKFIVFEYYIKNNSTVTYSSLYAGIYMDWDMSDDEGLSDRAGFDATNKMGYIYASAGGAYAGVKLLSAGTVRYYAFDNAGGYNGTSESIKVDDGFTGFEKYNAIKTNSNRNLAGVSLSGTDVSHMVSSGPFILNPKDSVKVVFALIMGDHLSDIQSSAEKADELYNNLTDVSEAMRIDDKAMISQLYPNPLTDKGYIDVNIPESGYIEAILFDLNGKKIREIFKSKIHKGKQTIEVDLQNLSSGFYNLQIIYQGRSFSRDVNLIR